MGCKSEDFEEVIQFTEKIDKADSKLDGLV